MKDAWEDSDVWREKLVFFLIFVEDRRSAVRRRNYLSDEICRFKSYGVLCSHASD